MYQKVITLSHSPPLISRKIVFPGGKNKFKLHHCCSLTTCKTHGIFCREKMLETCCLFHICSRTTRRRKRRRNRRVGRQGERGRNGEREGGKGWRGEEKREGRRERGRERSFKMKTLNSLSVQLSALCLRDEQLLLCILVIALRFVFYKFTLTWENRMHFSLWGISLPLYLTPPSSSLSFSKSLFSYQKSHWVSRCGLLLCCYSRFLCSGWKVFSDQSWEKRWTEGGGDSVLLKRNRVVFFKCPNLCSPAYIFPKYHWQIAQWR